MADLETTEPYGYSDLEAGEFRYLVLKPGALSDCLQCELHHTSFPAAPEYEAISYVWGNPEKNRRIQCDGKSMNITDSLWDALLGLRYKSAGKERVLWADAVCINQTCDRDKSQQVALMGMVYSHAVRTLIWLGKDASGAIGHGLQFISMLAPIVEYDQQDQENVVGVTESGARVHLRHGDFDSWILHAVLTVAPVFGAAWFRRLWTLQEVVLSRHAVLLAGSVSIPYSELQRAMSSAKVTHDFIYHQDKLDYRAITNFNNISQVSRLSQEKSTVSSLKVPPILHMMNLTAWYDYTDDRDGIYALLGMTTHPGFESDYNLSVEGSYSRFSIWALDTFPNLEMLSYARGLIPTQYEIPSWQPCPRQFENPVTFLNVRHFSAWEPQPLDLPSKFWSLSKEDGGLVLEGILVDAVLSRTASGKLFNGVSIKQRKEALLEALRISECKRQFLDDARYQRFWKAMTPDMDAPGTATDEYEYFNSIDPGTSQSARRSGSVDSVAQDRMSRSMTRWPRFRCFCLTHGDRFAWTPHMTEPGDKIFVIRGARLPYVLRPNSGGSIGTFTLVGECWLEGMMQGEAVDSVGMEWERICLL